MNTGCFPVVGFNKCLFLYDVSAILMLQILNVASTVASSSVVHNISMSYTCFSLYANVKSRSSVIVSFYQTFRFPLLQQA